MQSPSNGRGQGTAAIPSSTRKGLYNILSHPFRVPGRSDSQPRAALRLALGYGVQPLRGWGQKGHTEQNRPDDSRRLPSLVHDYCAAQGRDEKIWVPGNRDISCNSPSPNLSRRERGRTGRVAQGNAFLHRAVFLATLLAAWIAACVPSAAAVDRIEPMPKELENVGVNERLANQVPLDLSFVDSDGSPVTLAQFFDGTRPVILTMNYSNCPRLCSLQLNGVFAGLQKLSWDLGSKFQMLTVSIDPAESPARAQSTKEKYLTTYNRPNVENGWHCLVGKEEDIKALAAAVGFAYVYVPETKQYAHTAVTMILTPKGRVSRYLYGIEYDPQTLRFSLLEAADGKIGSTVDRVLLNCFYYDAEAGRYGPAALKIMRLGGLATLAILGCGLLALWGREWRRKTIAGQEHTANSPLPFDGRGELR
jgi:protein SCO1